MELTDSVIQEIYNKLDLIRDSFNDYTAGCKHYAGQALMPDESQVVSAKNKINNEIGNLASYLNSIEAL